MTAPAQVTTLAYAALNQQATEIGLMVDELGTLKAEISNLEDTEKELVKIIKHAGEGQHNGRAFRATVFTQERESIDWKSILDAMCLKHDLTVTPQLLSAHTKKSSTTVLKVVSR